MEDKNNPVVIKEMPAGPYVITGEFKMIKKDGTEEVVTGPKGLCRCGHSKHKPFCDGSHAKIHFEQEK